MKSWVLAALLFSTGAVVAGQPARDPGGASGRTPADAGKPAAGALERMARIRLPSVQFADTPLDQALLALRKAAAERDPERRGVNLAIDFEGIFGLTAEEYARRGAAMEGLTNASVARVTFSSKDITMLEAVKSLASSTGMKLREDGDLVVVCPLNAPDSPIVVRRYEVEYSLFDALERSRYESDPNYTMASPGRPDLKAALAALGAKWPIGAYVRYLPSAQRLVVGNTEANLAVVETLLKEMMALPCQVEVEVQFVSFARADVARFGPRGVRMENLVGLWTNGQAELLAAPRLVTRSGAEATVKGVTEYIYPTGVSLEPGPTNAVKDAAVAPGANGGIAAPSQFETREVGAILSVMPEVAQGGTRITLTLTPEIVQEPTWRKYQADCTDSDGRTHSATVEQPFFYTYTITTQVTLADGVTMLVGGGIPARDDKRIIFIFATARLVDMTGKPLNPE